MSYILEPELLAKAHIQYELKIRGESDEGDEVALRVRLREVVGRGTKPDLAVLRTLDPVFEIDKVRSELENLFRQMKEADPETVTSRCRQIISQCQHNITRVFNLKQVVSDASIVEQIDALIKQGSEELKVFTELVAAAVSAEQSTSNSSLFSVPNAAVCTISSPVVTGTACSTFAFSTSSFSTTCSASTPSVSVVFSQPLSTPATSSRVFSAADFRLPHVSAPYTISQYCTPQSVPPVSQLYQHFTQPFQPVSQSFQHFQPQPFQPAFAPFSHFLPQPFPNCVNPNYAQFTYPPVNQVFPNPCNYDFSRYFNRVNDSYGVVNAPSVILSTDTGSVPVRSQPVYSSSSPRVAVSASTNSTNQLSFANSSLLRNSRVYGKMPNPMERLLRGLPETSGLFPEKLIQFLGQVLLIRDKVGASDADILEGILPFTSPPLSQSVQQALSSSGSFDDFHRSALQLFPPLMGRRLCHSLVDRFQKEGESFADFIHDISLMARCVRDPRSEAEIVDIIISNMHPATGAYFTFQSRPTTFADLIKLSQIAQDRTFAESQRKDSRPFFKSSVVNRPGVSSFSNNRQGIHAVNHPPSVPTDFSLPPPGFNAVNQNISASKPSGNASCWTCGEKGHTSRTCPQRAPPKN